MINRYKKARYKRNRLHQHQRNAKERLRIERAKAEWREEDFKADISTKTAKPDLIVKIESSAGFRLQFSAIYFNGKLVGQGFSMSPKRFGRKLGEMFDLWSRA